MTLLEALAVYLNSKSAITDEVGSRIYRGKRPQGTSLPCIVYSKASNLDQLYQTGTSTLAWTRIQIECIAEKPDTAETIRDAVRDVCQRYSGTITSGEETVTVVLVMVENDYEDTDEPKDASDTATFYAICDLYVWWRPVAPTG